MDKIEHRAKFDSVRYANCWEDTEILCEALNPSPGKRLLSIASAGDNSLALLGGGAEVIAVDLNPSQLACVELRREAIRQLDYDDCLAFFGIGHGPGRSKTFSMLSGSLSVQARDFWNSNLDIIEDGFIHCGKFEKYFHLFRKWVLRLIHSPKTVELLLAPKDREARIRFYEDTWANSRWHLLFKVFFSEFVMGRLGRDPEFFRYVEVPVAENILERSKYALTELETNNNPYLDYILTGNFNHSLPFYLLPENFLKIRENLDNLVLFQGPVEKAAEKYGDEGFDGYNLSDIFEYLDQETCLAIYRQLVEKARSGARFAYWNMLVPRQCSSEMAEKITFLAELSGELFARDKAFFYSRFVVEEVK